MQNSKLLKVLQTFSDKEKKLFLKFVYSPFFNENEKVCQFATYLLAPKSNKKQQADEEGDYWTKKNIFLALYPDREYDTKADTDIRLLMSYLFRLMKKFITIHLKDEDLIVNKLIFAECLFSRNLDDFAWAEMEEIEESLNKKNSRNDAFFLDKFLLLERRGWGEMLMGIRNVKKKLDYIDLLKNLDVYYILKKMACYCIILNEKQIFANDTQPEMMPAILHFVKNTPTIFEIPTVKMYYYTILLFQSHENSEHYDTLFHLLKTEGDKCSQLDLRNLHTYARNYCIRRKKMGDKESSIKLLNLYEEQLEIGILHDERGEISVANVKNIVTLGLQMGKSEWLLNAFLPTQSEHIQVQQRENTLNYCYALIAFYKQEYSKSLSFAKQNDKPDSFFDVGSRRLAIKSFYELKEEDSALNDLRTFRKFLHDCNKKNLLPENTIQGNRAFCNLLERLITTPHFQAERLLKLQEEIAQTSICVEKEWLGQKLNEKA